MKQKKDQTNQEPSLFKKCLYFFTADKQGRTHYSDPVSAYQARPKRWIVNLVSFVIFVVVLIFMGKYIGIQNAFDSPIKGDLVAQRCHDFFLLTGITSLEEDSTASTKVLSTDVLSL